ncbi:MAG: glycogen synthase [Granulosicoccus sp.]
MSQTTHICMLAAENDNIPGGKVGGIGDVIRDIPSALARLGSPAHDIKVTVMIPAYGALHLLPDAVRQDVFTTGFRAKTERIELFEYQPGKHAGVRYLMLHHPLFAAGGAGRVYCDDDTGQPFATDASKFALFSIACITAIRDGIVSSPDVLHLHDWHTALAKVLIHYDDSFSALRDVRCVYSIHNLALQGIRPFAENSSSLQAWFPHLHYDSETLADPRWPHCINPVASAIRLASRVHTVSPSYAEEILFANNEEQGFHGGEGLENDLQHASDEGRLIGIINGIDYSATAARKLAWGTFLEKMSDELLKVTGAHEQLRSVDYVAHQRLLQWQYKDRPDHVITSVGRLTTQKIALLLEPRSDGNVPLEEILSSLNGRGIFILLGSGDRALEATCRKMAARYSHFVFISQYSTRLSSLLFSNGDLFLMPSSFEPCGISQMLAMQHGQPCIAHAVGGLIDTIHDDVDGFLFHGEDIEAKRQALVQRFNQVINLRETRPTKYSALSEVARKQRFDWEDSAKRYLQELYS